MLQSIRAFFAQRRVLEVERPIVSTSAVTDIHLHSFKTTYRKQDYYLHTSPEFFMKRLLAAGSGDIYQMCKVFRDDEQGKNHNPEFTMLEWYRPGWTLDALIDETVAVIALISGLNGETTSITWRDAFRQHAGIDPHRVDDAALAARCEGLPTDVTRDECLDWIWSEHVEPHLGQGAWCVVRDWPAGRAAQAQVRTDPDGFAAALRFEIVRDGIELANGYDECGDAELIAARFAERLAAQPDLCVDESLLAALRAGFPPCVGVAVGFDRCLMLGDRRAGIAATTAFADG